MDLAHLRERKAQQALTATTRQVMMHATSGERHEVNRLLDAMDAGQVTRADAHEALRCLQRGQQAAA